MCRVLLICIQKVEGHMRTAITPDIPPAVPGDVMCILSLGRAPILSASPRSRALFPFLHAQVALAARLRSEGYSQGSLFMSHRDSYRSSDTNLAVVYSDL